MTSAYRTDRTVFVSGFGLTQPLPVVVSPDDTFDVSDQQLAVPASTLTTIATYTNSTGGPVFLDGWHGTGQYEGDWFVAVDSVVRPEDRSSASTMRSGVQFTTPRRIENGSIVDIKVQHYGAGTGQFSATLFFHK
jgi:hypothetical protein